MDAYRWRIRGAQEADVSDLFTIVAQFATSFVPERRAFQRAFERLLGEHACLLVADHDGMPGRSQPPERGTGQVFVGDDG
jgi:hypothetical protein